MCMYADPPQDSSKMAYRSSYVFRVVLCEATLSAVQAVFPCINLSSTDKLAFIDNHKEARLLNALQTKVHTEIVQTESHNSELRICANFAATYEVVDRIEYLIDQISEDLFGYLVVGEHLEDNFQKGTLDVGYVVRRICLPTGWTATQVFDRDDY